jgi:hypothetical protein
MQGRLGGDHVGDLAVVRVVQKAGIGRSRVRDQSTTPWRRREPGLLSAMSREPAVLSYNSLSETVRFSRADR